MRKGSQSEVTNNSIGIVSPPEHDILGLEVPMNDPASGQILKPAEKVSNDITLLSRGEDLVTLKLN